MDVRTQTSNKIVKLLCHAYFLVYHLSSRMVTYKAFTYERIIVGTNLSIVADNFFEAGEAFFLVANDMVR